MYITASFQNDVSLELALKDIQNKGIEKKNILCIPLDKRVNTEDFFDTVHRTDGKSTMGIPFVLATVFSLLGSIYGFIFIWGPITWAIIGFVFGMSLGLIINFLVFKKQKKHIKKDNLTEVMVIINSKESKEDDVIKILWEQYALGVGKLYTNVKIN